MATIPTTPITSGLNIALMSSCTSPAVGQVSFDYATGRFMIWTSSNWADLTHAYQPWCLFIDDIRKVSDVDLNSWNLPTAGLEIKIAETYEAAIRYLDLYGLPEYVSFDHDLGENQPPATAIMWHIINGHLDEKWNCASMKVVQVHSANPVGARNLLLLWQGFCKEHGLTMDIVSAPALK